MKKFQSINLTIFIIYLRIYCNCCRGKCRDMVVSRTVSKLKFAHHCPKNTLPFICLQVSVLSRNHIQIYLVYLRKMRVLSIKYTLPPNITLQTDWILYLTSNMNCCLVSNIFIHTYLLYGTTALEELSPPSNKGFFIWFNFSYTDFLL